MDFPGGPVVKNLPCNAEDVGSIPGWGRKILHAPEQGSPRTMRSNKRKSPCAASKTLHSQINTLKKKKKSNPGRLTPELTLLTALLLPAMQVHVAERFATITNFVNTILRDQVEA